MARETATMVSFPTEKKTFSTAGNISVTGLLGLPAVEGA